jgi:hypothetical protein
LADSSDSAEDRSRAYFFAGSLRLLDGEQRAAADAFMKCIDAGGDAHERWNARAELARIGH